MFNIVVLSITECCYLAHNDDGRCTGYYYTMNHYAQYYYTEGCYAAFFKSKYVMLSVVRLGVTMLSVTTLFNSVHF